MVAVGRACDRHRLGNCPDLGGTESSAMPTARPNLRSASSRTRRITAYAPPSAQLQGQGVALVLDMYGGDAKFGGKAGEGPERRFGMIVPEREVMLHLPGGG